MGSSRVWKQFLSCQQSNIPTMNQIERWTVPTKESIQWDRSTWFFCLQYFWNSTAAASAKSFGQKNLFWLSEKATTGVAHHHRPGLQFRHKLNTLSPESLTKLDQILVNLTKSLMLECRNMQSHLTLHLNICLKLGIEFATSFFSSSPWLSWPSKDGNYGKRGCIFCDLPHICCGRFPWRKFHLFKKYQMERTCEMYMTQCEIL